MEDYKWGRYESLSYYKAEALLENPTAFWDEHANSFSECVWVMMMPSIVDESIEKRVGLTSK